MLAAALRQNFYFEDEPSFISGLCYSFSSFYIAQLASS